MTREEQRLHEANQRRKEWKHWGPYVAERAWGTVREDYSASGDPWDYFPHYHARSRAYRWNEDGLAGICDRHQYLCFGLALWNEKDPILKERLFGLSNHEGNHGEDVKECYFYLDNTPTHSYMKYLYKYPQAEFPYDLLREENGRRGKGDPEYELIDTGVFNENRYFDVFMEYAKVDVEDICIRITVANRALEAARLRVLPSLWYRNRWSWHPENSNPGIRQGARMGLLEASGEELGDYDLYFEGAPELLFTENETNLERLYNVANLQPYVKDAFHEYVIAGKKDVVNPGRFGTKAALHYSFDVPGGGEITLKLRLRNSAVRMDCNDPLGMEFDQTFAARKAEADEYYAAIIPQSADADTRNIMRQAFAGLLWTKQYYHYVVRDWLNGDPGFPPPPPERKEGRNHNWTHIYNADVISMPDKWEYPWYAAWDLAFHCVAFAHIDPEFAKQQLVLMLREWYMHPNGQIPAYEWEFGNVNPPVHAWASYKVYLIDKQKRGGRGDRAFLERIFHKLMLNFTWWVNRKDPEGQNVFQGGFLGLDNIGLFDRNTELPSGDRIEQSDGTSWMEMYSLDLLAIALELASEDPVYEDVASKFWEHFVYIAWAMNHMGDDGLSLWDEQDGFFYDVLHGADGQTIPIRVRSMVGLIPLHAVQTIEPELLDKMPTFRERLEWFIENRPDLTGNVACMKTQGHRERRLFSIANQAQLRRMLETMLDEHEFLSTYGIRALSRYHKDHPYTLDLDGVQYSIGYEPAESSSGMFGGNSNWRGPIWMPVNYLLTQGLRRFFQYYGDSLKVECPTGSGQLVNLEDAANIITDRVVSIFRRDANGRRPVFGGNEVFQSDPHWRDYIPFYEYFHGDNGRGVGASHQTGWTALVASMISELAERQAQNTSTVVAGTSKTVPAD